MRRNSNGAGLWIILAIVLLNMFGVRALAVLAPVAVALLVLRSAVIRNRRQREDETSAGADTRRVRPVTGPTSKADTQSAWPGVDSTPVTDTRWRDERHARQQGFDDQRARQGGPEGGAPLSTGSDHDEYLKRVRTLKDLLSAGIIDHAEYSERMAALHSEWDE